MLADGQVEVLGGLRSIGADEAGGGRNQAVLLDALGKMLAPARFDGNRHRALLREEGFAPLLAFARLTRTDAWREGEEHWLERTSADLTAGGRLTSRREPMGVQPPERTLCQLEEFALSRDAASAEDALDEMLARARFSGELEDGEGE